MAKGIVNVTLIGLKGNGRRGNWWYNQICGLIKDLKKFNFKKWFYFSLCLSDFSVIA